MDRGGSKRPRLLRKTTKDGEVVEVRNALGELKRLWCPADVPLERFMEDFRNSSEEIQYAELKAHRDREAIAKRAQEDAAAKKPSPGYTPLAPAAMDAEDYDPKHVRFPVMVQPKMDGCRVRLFKEKGKVYVLSRTNNTKPTWLMSTSIFKDILEDGQMADAEFYSTTMRPWQEVNGLFHKKDEPIMHVKTMDMCYFCFDLINVHGPNEPYHKRYAALKEAVAKISVPGWDDPYSLSNFARVVPSYKVSTFEELDARYNEILAQGYEGIVVRDPRAQYEARRSIKLMKRKPITDAEYVIHDMFRASYGVHVECQFPDDPTQTFAAQWHMADRLADDTIRQKGQHAGRMVTVMYSNTTTSGKPRSALVKGIRLDLDCNVQVKPEKKVC